MAKKPKMLLPDTGNKFLNKRMARLSFIMSKAKKEMRQSVEACLLGKYDAGITKYVPPTRSCPDINKNRSGMLGGARHEEIIDALKHDWREVLNAFYRFPPHSREWPVALFETPSPIDTYLFKVTVNLPENRGRGYGVTLRQRKALKLPDMIACLPYLPPLVIEIGDCNPTKWPTSWWFHIHWDLTIGDHNRPHQIDNWWLLAGNFLELSLQYCLAKRRHNGDKFNQWAIGSALILMGYDDVMPLFRQYSYRLYHYGLHNHIFSTAVTYLLAHYYLYAFPSSHCTLRTAGTARQAIEENTSGSIS